MQSPCLRLVCLLLAASAAFPWGAGAAGGDRTEEAESLRPLVKRLARNIGQDQKRIWTSPFRITRKNARWWLTFGAATGLLIATDSRTSRQLPNTADQVAFSRHVSQVGAVYTLIPTACGLYLSGLLAHDAKLRETGLLGGEALADALIVSEVLKLAAGRQRPLEADGGGHFFHAGTSFPSGHAIESFALASVISHRYGNRKAVAVLAYGLPVQRAKALCVRHPGGRGDGVVYWQACVRNSPGPVAGQAAAGQSVACSSGDPASSACRSQLRNLAGLASLIDDLSKTIRRRTRGLTLRNGPRCKRKPG